METETGTLFCYYWSFKAEQNINIWKIKSRKVLNYCKYGTCTIFYPKIKKVYLFNETCGSTTG